MENPNDAMLSDAYLKLHDKMCEVELRLKVESDADIL